MELSKAARAARKVLPLKSCGAVIVAAGTASRMGGIDKVMAPLGGEPMIVRTVRAFQDCEAIREIVIVTREDLILQISGLCREMDKVKAVVKGGGSRQESVWLGAERPVQGHGAGGHSGWGPAFDHPGAHRQNRPGGS